MKEKIQNRNTGEQNRESNIPSDTNDMAQILPGNGWSSYGQESGI